MKKEEVGFVFGKVYDPVCKRKIKKSRAGATSEYEGKLYYFCSQDCRDKFKEEPRRYI